MRQRLWIGAVAAVLLVGMSVSAAPGGGDGAPQDQATFVGFFKNYDQAFMAKDLEKLATFYHPDVTVYEGGGINPGWADYRDRHLGPELKAFGNLKFEHINITARAIGPDAAYVTGEYLLDATTEAREIRSGGLATYVMIREAGVWKIRHSHTSSKRRPAASS
jgi:ketosteroid isomerase-like protein